MSVEGANEFFANEILVHNCDAASLGYRMLISAGVQIASVPPNREIESALEGMVPKRSSRDPEAFFKSEGKFFE